MQPFLSPEETKRMWAIEQAVKSLAPTSAVSDKAVLAAAQNFYDWIEEED